MSLLALSPPNPGVLLGLRHFALQGGAACSEAASASSEVDSAVCFSPSRSYLEDHMVFWL